ncbi:MAG: hypothetical protein ACLUKN_01625 [Bacilli bacterium]
MSPHIRTEPHQRESESRGIGRIGGGGGLPSVGGMYQWMCTGISYQSMSDGNYKVSKLILSGPEGWNRYIQLILI